MSLNRGAECDRAGGLSRKRSRSDMGSCLTDLERKNNSGSFFHYGKTVSGFRGQDCLRSWRARPRLNIRFVDTLTSWTGGGISCEKVQNQSIEKFRLVAEDTVRPAGNDRKFSCGKLSGELRG